MVWYGEITDYSPCEHEEEHGCRWLGMGNRVLTGVNMKGSMAVDSLVLGNHRLLNLVNMKGSMAIDGLVRGTEYLPCEHEGQYGYRWLGMGK